MSVRLFLLWENFLPSQYIRNGAPHHIMLITTATTPPMMSFDSQKLLMSNSHFVRESNNIEAT